MRSRIRTALIPFVLLAVLAPGCSDDSGDRTGASPNRDIGRKYKHLIGKDGKPLWKPGMPKKLPTDKSKPRKAG